MFIFGTKTAKGPKLELKLLSVTFSGVLEEMLFDVHDCIFSSRRFPGNKSIFISLE